MKDKKSGKFKMKSVAAGVKLRHSLVCLYQDRALIENLQHLIRGGMYLLRCGIAQVNDKGVLLIGLVIIDPAAIRFLDRISAEMFKQYFFDMMILLRSVVS